jgi:hypothetical protein
VLARHDRGGRQPERVRSLGNAFQASPNYTVARPKQTLVWGLEAVGVRRILLASPFVARR